MSGSGPIYEYQRELTARLEQALRERDEARVALKDVAERQREACAEAFKPSNTALAYYEAEEIVRATPLVTEVDQ